MSSDMLVHRRHEHKNEKREFFGFPPCPTSYREDRPTVLGMSAHAPSAVTFVCTHNYKVMQRKAQFSQIEPVIVSMMSSRKSDHVMKTTRKLYKINNYLL